MDTKKLLVELKEEIAFRKDIVDELNKYSSEHLTGVKEGIRVTIEEIEKIIKKHEDLDLIADHIRKELEKGGLNGKYLIQVVKKGPSFS